MKMEENRAQESLAPLGRFAGSSGIRCLVCRLGVDGDESDAALPQRDFGCSRYAHVCGRMRIGRLDVL